MPKTTNKAFIKQGNAIITLRLDADKALKRLQSRNMDSKVWVHIKDINYLMDDYERVRDYVKR